jgi:hypothetical protein
MREARGMAAAAAVVMVVALLGCGGGTKDKENAPTASDATPPAQDRDNPAQPASNPANSDSAAANPAGADQYDPATAAGAVKGVPDPGNTGQIEAVANYFAELPGFDLAPLGERGKAKFLHRVNSEMCTCGCKNDTLAHCMVNDPKCPQVKGLVQAVYDEVKSGR